MHTIRLKDDYIKLGQALKAAGGRIRRRCKICRTGRPGKVNGQTGTQRGKKAGIRR